MSSHAVATGCRHPLSTPSVDTARAEHALRRRCGSRWSPRAACLLRRRPRGRRRACRSPRASGRRRLACVARLQAGRRRTPAGWPVSHARRRADRLAWPRWRSQAACRDLSTTQGCDCPCASAGQRTRCAKRSMMVGSDGPCGTHGTFGAGRGRTSVLTRLGSTHPSERHPAFNVRSTPMRA